MRRWLAIAALVLTLLAAVAVATFPTDAIVRSVLDRIPLPDGMQLTFARARLRPSGVLFDDVHVVRPDGRPALDAQWLRLRPALLGFWRDRTGRPWHVAAATCHGRVDLTIDAVRDLTAVAFVLDEVELAACLPYVGRQMDAYGRLTGTAVFRVGGGSIDASDGALEIRGAAWTPGDPVPGVRLKVDAGRVRWRLANHRLELETIEASSEDFQALGRGSVRFVAGIDDSVLDLRLAVTPGPTMPPLLRRHLEAIPGAAPNAQGTRTFRLEGSLRDPRLSARGTLE